MQKTIILPLVIMLAVGGYFLANRSVPSVENSSTPSTSINTFTLEDISKHSTETDCWSAINNNVYDITKMVAVHKGGKEKILSICGKDGTAGFTAMHGSNDKVQSLLASMQVGSVK